MTRYFFRTISLIAFVIIVSALTAGVLLGSPQEDISGIINTYTRVNTIEAEDAVLVDDVSGFSIGDTVLVIQMKGVSIYTTQSGLFGSYDGYLGQPGPYGVGFYELIIIEQLEAGPGRITFRNNLLGYDNYDAEGFIQVVKVPSYESATVTGELTCPEWDSIAGTGGVLALIVSKKLELEADIDVSGKGFKGGEVTSMDGTPYNDPDYFYDEASTIAGRKGESMASHRNATADVLNIYDYAKGVGRLYTGGGGATGEYSGGGGGASFGSGGNGYRQGTETFNVSGRGGLNVEAPDFADRVIMGGGGGGSGSNGGTGSGGGSGGGIIFILTDTLVGNNHSLKANGDSITVIASGDGGAGGGGGGGSLVLSVKSYASSDINIEARGGRGGHSYELFGTGGGGGGGLVWLNGTGTEPELNVNVVGGAAGRINFPVGSSAGSGGSAGLLRTGLNMKLNGFLFNSILSSRTGTQTDSICYGQIPEPFFGTEPVGGVEPYIFRWEKKGDSDINWSLVPGSGDTKDLVYTDPETDTLQIRRIVTDSNVSTPVSDTSKAVTIIVQPLISNNIVGYDTIICNGDDPIPLIPANGDPTGGNNIFTYTWIDSTAVQDWQAAPGAINDESYDPPELTVTSYYSRLIESGMCIDTSNIVAVTVLPVITNNTIERDQFICSDDLFDDLSGSDPLNGDGTYSFEWRVSPDQVTWDPAPGTNDARDYNPDETIGFPGEQYFRRIVKSGLEDCCKDTSASVTLTSLAAIENNIISADQTICQFSVPAIITGQQPTAGDGNYSFIWEDSTRSQAWALIADANQLDYNPPALADTTWYRRIVISSVCDDTSNVVPVNVHPEVINNNISTLSGLTDTIICHNQIPGDLVADDPGGGTGTYAFLWEYSIDNELSWDDAPGINTLAGYSPQALTGTTWFRRRVYSGECESASNPVLITVLPPISNNSVSEDQTSCYNTQPEIIEGSEPAGGDGVYTYLWEISPDNTNWLAAPGDNTGNDYQPGPITEISYFRRIVYSGLSDCCQDISPSMRVGYYDLPTGTITDAQDTTCAGSPISVSLSLTGAAPWTVTLNDGTGDLSSFVVTDANYDFVHNPVYTSDYTYASITDINSCEASDMSGSRKVIVYQVPVADPGPDDEVCGLEYTLEASPSVGTGEWLNFDGSIVSAVEVNSSSETVSVGSYGIHTFWWKETNWECIDSASVNVTFYEAPAPAFAGDDQLLKPFQFAYTLEAQQPVAGIGTWSVISSEGNPAFDDDNFAMTTVRDLYYGDNILEWTVVNGVCPAEQDRVNLKVNTVLIPDGFSPNGDAFNQTFVIEGVEFTENELVITNMAGAVVYRKSDYKGDWEGTGLDGQPLPEGTYYYFLRIKSPLNQRLSGFVLIKR
ncbi:MAG: gliding motility-associated C-terminal domain-containing protein [Bacteroidales bacterium]|nr:gliding motility-associated C-terminal domain-containing protein [Bacteroidales bacterium]